MSRAAAVAGDLAQSLRRAGIQDVDDSTLARALYASDASLYRVVPQVVVRPRHVDELVGIVEVARETGTPLTMRGAGTSIAGNAVGTGIVVDTSKHLNRVLELDPEGRRAVVEPGTVHATLQRAAAAQGLRFGPGPLDPHPLHGRWDGRQQRLWVAGAGLRPDGRQRDRPGRGAPSTVSGSWTPPCPGELERLVGRTPGHHPHRVRPLHPPGVRLLPSSTCCPRTAETCRPLPGRQRRHPWRRARGHGPAGRGRPVPGTGRAGLPRDVRGGRRRPRPADARPGGLRGAGPADHGRGPPSGVPSPTCPRGDGWLLRRGHRGRRLAEVESARRGCARRRRRGRDTGWSPTPAQMAALWRIREDGAGLAARSLDRPAQSGWEDAAVPPSGWGATCGPSTGCSRSTGSTGSPYGHFGDGCVHIRIDFPYARPEARGVPVVRRGGGRPGGVRTAAACPASTATAGPGPRCSPGCTRRRPSTSSRRSSASSTPATCSTPACSSTPTRRRRPPAGRRRCASRGTPWRWCTTAGRSSTPSIAAPGWASASRTTRPAGGRCARRTPRRARRRTPPGAGPGCCRRWSTAAWSPTAGAPTRCTRRSTSACPARAAPRTAPPASTWPPTRPRRCTSATADACVLAATTPSGSCRGGPASPPPVAPLVNATMRVPVLQRLAKAAAGIDQRRSVPAFDTVGAAALGPTPCPAPAPRRGASGPTPSPTASPPAPVVPPSRSSRRPACGWAWWLSTPAVGSPGSAPGSSTPPGAS